nr:YceI family protein [uncultured Carboxylicivirga sp.]
MKVISLIAALLILVSSTTYAQSKKVDTKKSVIEWKGEKVTGEHSGTILFKSGELEFKDSKLTGGEFVVDMTSITNTDLADEEYNKKLVGHLKSDDFFGVATYPESTLELSSVKAKGDAYEVNGKLTIKGKTHPIAFDVKEADGVFTGVMKVDRTKYDVRYGSGKFFDNLGDKVIYDEFTLTFKVFTN